MSNRTVEKKIEAGNDILAYCGKCKDDSDHTIASMEGDKICKVLCKTCKALHNYRRPKKTDKENSAISTSKSTKSTSSQKGSRKSKSSKKWNDLIANYDLDSALDYSMKNEHEESSLIRHPSFGVGVVLRKIDQNKIEVQFENDIKLLVINRN